MTWHSSGPRASRALQSAGTPRSKRAQVTAPPTCAPTTSSSSAAARPALPRRRWRRAPASPPSCSTRTPASASQIYRGITSTPVTDRSILGEDYWAGRGARQRGQGERRGDRERRHRMEPRSRAHRRRLDRRKGAPDRGQARHHRHGLAGAAVPDPGWTLPGVMTAGAAQTVLKAQGLLPDGRTDHGRHASADLWLLAAQILRAGGGLDADSRLRRAATCSRAAPYLPDFMLSPYFAKGPGAAARGEGQGAGPSRLECRGGGRRQAPRGRVRSWPDARPISCCCIRAWCPTIGSSRRSVRRAMIGTGASALLPAVLDRDFGSSMPAHRRGGRQRGHCGRHAPRPSAGGSPPSPPCAARARCPRARSAERAPAPAREEMGAPFLDWLNRPAESFRQPVGDTLVCRCEEVTAAQVRSTADLGCEDRTR